ncbi:hypothetical protein AB0L40_05710 [Patulibacter sp. NPDC049589]|uniref:hypothetical protein n=1 Tax=Patulibacter sp. NPDC049589 TaxID=3154731 RepID=UPI003446B510
MREEFSAHGEDAVITRLLAQLPQIERSCVDLAASDGVNLSNTLRLYRDGWSGLAFDADSALFAHLAATHRRSPQVALVRTFVDPQNVCALLSAHRISATFGFLNLDIDSYDYFVLEALLETYRPTLICTEIQEIIPPPVRFAVKYSDVFEPKNPHFFGHSLSQVSELLRRSGYDLAAVHYNNAFFVERGHGIRSLDDETAFREGYVEQPDRTSRFAYNAEYDELLEADPAVVVDRLKNLYAGERPGSYTLEA